jgi:hypothetical protein
VLSVGRDSRARCASRLLSLKPTRISDRVCTLHTAAALHGVADAAAAAPITIARRAQLAAGVKPHNWPVTDACQLGVLPLCVVTGEQPIAELAGA